MILVVDTSARIGKIEDVGYVHYDTELLSTEQVTVKTEKNETFKQALARVDGLADNYDVKGLKYLGVEGHWKVYYIEGSLTKFVY